MGNTFPFTYDLRESSKLKGDYPDPGHDVADLRAESTVAVEFQIHSRNFKASKTAGESKGFSFRLLGIYLIGEPRIQMVSTPEASSRADGVDAHAAQNQKRTCSSMNPFNSNI